MPTTTLTSGKLKFEFSLGGRARAVPRDPDAPLHILVMGDFGGQRDRLARRVDCDNFDEVLASVKPLCRVPLGAKTAELGFSTLDDFHPGRILPIIEPLLEPAV